MSTRLQIALASYALLVYLTFTVRVSTYGLETPTSNNSGIMLDWRPDPNRHEAWYAAASGGFELTGNPGPFICGLTTDC